MRSRESACRKWSAWLLALGVAAALCVPAMAAPDANTCNGNSELSYPSAPNFSSVGDTVHIVLTLGAGGIEGGTSLSIARVKFNLDCNNTQLGINCVDDGGVVSYQANLTTDCASNFTTPTAAGDTLPNQVVFTPDSPIVIPAGATAFCTLSFDVRIETTSNDGTPTTIEQVSGFDASTGDGVCDTTPPLAAGNTNSGSLGLCPVCDDGNQCNGLETCDPTTGCVPGTPIVCDDNNVCTSDRCDETIPPCDAAVGGICGDPCVFTPGALDCNDNNVCTEDTCDPILGCQHGTPDACDDNNVCTEDTCDPILGCQHGTPDACDDNNVCTKDTCDPILGCQHGTPDACDDNNVCTEDTCDPILGCQHGTPDACDDNDVCTEDSCDPILGCQHGEPDPCDDGNPCTNDSCDPVEGCVNAPNGDPSCSLPCRITGGGLVEEDTGEIITDPSILAEIQRASFGGQVGAPFGLVGCHDDFDQIQGEWTHLRHKHRGSFHAADYNSLVCGCDDGEGGPGNLDGNLCNPGDREPGPEPRPAPANIACWTGVGDYNPTNGRRTIRVAFRVEVEDRGEPGAGQNAGSLEDVYRIRIWIPTHSEDANVLANLACCTNEVPDIRLPNVSDGGNLIHGNIQIHPPTGNPTNP
jgi:hypothetical protein